MISFRDFAMRRGERLLLSNVDLTLHAGWRVGVIGRNGTGKSSLFAAIQGEVEADRGDIDVPNRVRIASVAQETPALDDPALDFVLSGDSTVYKVLVAEREAVEREDWEAVAEAHHQLEELGGYDATARAGKLLHGLGFSPDTHERAVKEFSGGWRVRLNLARALMTPSDLLLLDEPTNHLDLDAVLWLEQWLLKYPGTLLLISHDREFLDEVTTHTLHLHDGKAKLYTGDYTAFERQRAEHLRLQQITHEKQQAERAHLQSFIDRFSASAAKAKQAQSRVKRLAKMVGTEAVRMERAMRIEFPAPAKLPHALLRVVHADCGYGDHVVLDDVSFILEAGDRIALLGPNGAGKSTLVKTLVGELELLAGDRSGHPDLRIGYFAQHTVESLHEGVSAIDHLIEIAPGVATQQLRDFLGKWNFPGDRAFESVDGFSGGERARLALAMIAWRKPNVLLLDEPTNHLDLDVREALAEALSDFEGAIVLVSHDRHLIGLVCETFWRVADGVAQPFDGDLDAYAVWLRTRDNSNDGKGAAASKAAAAAAAASAAAPAGKSSRKANPLKLAEAEKRMAELESKLHTLDMDLADPTKYAGGGDNAAELAKQREKVAAELVKAEAEWMALYDAA
ncbi:ABC-F family ATP-binding cassette domain-containing protein [Lysobacter capsici]|uniref:ABC-F family ATP-binding cassette domain-containing protein n=1 Tax=Lysobacter capsici TaxID=435897 RepID=UPI001BFFFA7E|nr:ATP-binding cassette domain-containing protein [Lysobacter capsici]QWF16002.1 ATP-binding cassette domain-containing protein [Lysobacter capsici]